jgi:hypothetical protein
VRVRVGAAFLLALGTSAGFALATWLPWGPGGGAQRARVVHELAQTREALERMQRLTQVDQRAAAQLQAELVRAEAERADLARQLAVYQRVLAAGGTHTDLAIEDVSLYRGGPGDVPRFRIVLAQGTRPAVPARGTLELMVRGRHRGAWADVALARSEYRFHYLQVLDGDLRLPAGLDPVELRVRLIPRGDGKRLERVFAWAALLEGTASRAPAHAG